MENTTLIQYLTENEIKKIKKTAYINNDILKKKLLSVTVSDLVDISLIVLQTEYGDNTPKTFLSSKCLEILLKRYIKLTMKEIIFDRLNDMI